MYSGNDAVCCSWGEAEGESPTVKTDPVGQCTHTHTHCTVHVDGSPASFSSLTLEAQMHFEKTALEFRLLAS